MGSELKLPPLQRELEINYTALSFKTPQKVVLRYRLDGHDTEWQDPGARRQAFYNDLGPGKYRLGHLVRPQRRHGRLLGQRGDL
jgi:hypothetical protein